MLRVEREIPQPLEARLEARDSQAVAAIIVDRSTNLIYTIEEKRDNPEYGKMAGMRTIPMETIEPGEDPEQQTLPRLFKEEVDIFGDNIRILRTEYVGYYGVGAAAARLYLTYVERDGVTGNDNGRNNSDSEQDVVDPIWMPREEINSQWVRMGVAEMLEDAFSGKRNVIRECKPVPLFKAELGVPEIVKRVETSFLSFVETPTWALELKRRNSIPERVVIADPLSYCAGVERAISAADRILEEYAGQPVYFYHAPIHSDSKLAEWEAKGGRVVNDMDNIPYYSPVLLSAHGISPEVWRKAKERKLKGYDTTCPLVDKTHREVIALARQDYKIIVVGEKKHDEIQGLVGEAPEHIKVLHPNASTEEIDELLETLSGEKIAIRNQTTLAYYDLLGLIAYVRERRPDVNEAKTADTCFATQDRQEAIIAAIEDAGASLAIIFGSDETKRAPSGNSIRLRDISKNHGAYAYLIEDISEINPNWFTLSPIVGVSAGASAAPQRVIEFLSALRGIGLRNDQIRKITVAQEPQVFAPARGFDFSQ